MAQRAFDPASEVYQRLIERDEYREDGHDHLMQCYWNLGRRKAALEQYEHCAALLERDLGLRPIEHLTSYYEAMLRPKSAFSAQAGQRREGSAAGLPRMTAISAKRPRAARRRPR